MKKGVKNNKETIFSRIISTPRIGISILGIFAGILLIFSAGLSYNNYVKISANAIAGREISCGNTILEPEEICEFNQDYKCSSFGYQNGDVSCCEGCWKFDLSNCQNISRFCINKIGDSRFIASNLTYSNIILNGPGCYSEKSKEENSGNIGDVCINNTHLNEATCDDNDNLNIKIYDCTLDNMVCNKGACIVPSQEIINNQEIETKIETLTEIEPELIEADLPNQKPNFNIFSWIKNIFTSK